MIMVDQYSYIRTAHRGGKYTKIRIFVQVVSFCFIKSNLIRIDTANLLRLDTEIVKSLFLRTVVEAHHQLRK